jgi:hypothetical protein
MTMPLKNLSKRMWDAPTTSATFFVGAKRGKNNKENQTRAFCKKQPQEFALRVLDTRLRALRILWLRARGVPKADARVLFAASRVGQKGWYKGAPEKSAAYTIFHNPDVPGEATPAEFKAAMAELAELTAAGLCQDEVIVSFVTPAGAVSEGYEPDLEDREDAEGAFSRFGKRKGRKS